MNPMLFGKGNNQPKHFSMINENSKSQMINDFMGQIKTEDMLNVGFMKPIEVTLRTNKTDKTVPPDSLPQGLMMAIKDKGINDNKYKLEIIKPINPEINTLQKLKKDNLDNYISLLKKHPQEQVPKKDESEGLTQVEAKPNHIGLELGICISMSNQDKKVLKKTIVGVARNVDEMIRSGVSPDDVFVVVMIDGIQNVDKTLYEYFEEFQRESEIFLEEDDDLTLKKKYQHSQFHQQIQKQQPLNFSKFLFKPQEFSSRIESKFQHVRAKYDEVLRIKKSIQNIKKQNNKDNDNLKMILNRMIDKQKDIMKKINKDKKVMIDEESIMKELATSEEQCNQYISTRDSLAYVSAYRVPTSSLAEECKDSETKHTLDRISVIQGKFETERMYDQELLQKTNELSRLSNSSRLAKKTIRYVNLYFCIKYKQSGKLSSHNWFFNGFCQQLNPKYAIIIDVGVRPYPDSIFKMYRCMKLNENVGSVCGYMRLIQQKVEDEEMTKSQDMDCISSIFSSIFDIQRAQQIQNHFQHLVQKPFQAFFKFIHVLPGYFSGYNMSALRSGGKDQLLRQYFRSMDEKLASNKIVTSSFTGGQIMKRVFLPKSIQKCLGKIDPDSQEQVLYNENIFLAQDRILCLGIHRNDKDIYFMPDVYAQVEPIKMINDLMGQKKRQINGGQFSFEKVKAQLSNTQSKRTNFFIKFQLVYLSMMKFLSYFAPAILIFAFEFTFQIVRDEFLADLFASQSTKGVGSVIYSTITTIVVFIYALMLGTILFYSLHVNYKNKKFIYFTYLITTQLGLFSFLSFIVFFTETMKGFVGTGDYLRKSYYLSIELILPGYGLLLVNCLRYAIASSTFVIILPVLVYSIFFRKLGILWDIIVGTASYIFYLPTYVAVLPIYSKCRLDDISSGTKANLGSRNQRLKETWQIIKIMYISKYFFWNAVVSVVLIILHANILIKFFLLLGVLVMFTIIQLIKLIPGIIYTISYKCNMSSNPLKPTEKEVLDNFTFNKERIFDVIKRFQEDFKTEIQYSFQMAAQEMEFEQTISQMNQMSKLPIQGQSPQINRLDSIQVVRPSRQSIKIMQHFQGNKFGNIRESSAVKGNKFLHFGAKKQDKTNQPPSTPLQMVLLKQKIGQQAAGNNKFKSQEHKLKQYQSFRNTIKPFM